MSTLPAVSRRIVTPAHGSSSVGFLNVLIGNLQTRKAMFLLHPVNQDKLYQGESANNFIPTLNQVWAGQWQSNTKTCAWMHAHPTFTLFLSQMNPRPLSLSHTWFETDDEKIWPLWPADHWSCTTDHLWKTCKNRWTKSDQHSTGAADWTKTPGLNHSASPTLPGYKRHTHHNKLNPNNHTECYTNVKKL